MSASLTLEPTALPQHVAIIMDGNGRWAKQQGKPRVWGHKKGADSVRRSVRFCRELGIPALTLFAFSSENWQRPADEVSSLMQLFKLMLNSEVKNLHKNQVRLRVIGDLSAFDASLIAQIQSAEQLTAQNEALTLNIAANYGGRWDIVHAARQLAQQVRDGLLTPEAIDEQLLGRYIQLSDLPELDLLIRTGGDERISNFLLWQAAYAELWFTDTLWPDFDQQVFGEAIASYVSRERRFGCTSEQVCALAASQLKG